MSQYIDLHVHSTCSDGTFAPARLSRYAAEKGLKAFALTDHDTLNGIEEATKAALQLPIEVIPGIELCAFYYEREIHILGLGIDLNDRSFRQSVLEFQKSRTVRNEKLIHKLQKESIDISYKSMQKTFPDIAWTRAHFANYLVQHDIVRTRKEAFERYLGNRACCFVPREKITPLQIIQSIHTGKGAAVLAHPLLYGFSAAALENLVIDLKTDGLDGIEAIYSTHRSAEEKQMIQLADKHGLKISGGSDFHGDNKPDIDLGTGKGNLKIPYSIWDSLQKMCCKAEINDVY